MNFSRVYSYITRVYSYVTRMLLVCYWYVVHMCSFSHDLRRNDHRTIANKLALIIIAKNTTGSPDLEILLEGLIFAGAEI